MDGNLVIYADVLNLKVRNTHNQEGCVETGGVFCILPSAKTILF